MATWLKERAATSAVATDQSVRQTVEGVIRDIETRGDEQQVYGGIALHTLVQQMRLRGCREGA